MRCSQIKKGFFLSEQRCSVDHALASHMRGQRKFNREQENPEVRGGVNIADQSGYLPPTATISGKLLRHPQDLVIVELILSLLILFTAGIYFSRILLHNQGYPKVCPDSLNLLNAGDSFAGISSLTFCYLFSRIRDLIAMF
jgi:hypothetical protein